MAPTSDAVTLFVDRARAVRRDFGLGDPDTAAAVTEICATLDGLPLGIELAAARMAAMSAVEVRDRLADRFRLLQGSTPGPERQHTLRHAVAWSYDLLTEDERALLRATSVFAGGFELASIHAVAAYGDAVDVLRHLDSLVRKSLVVADHTTTRTRYSLFETIRQFAEDRLEAAGELAATRDRHAAHFAGEAGARWDRWNGPGWRDAVDWVEAEFGNLRAAFRWSSARGEVAVATDIAAHAALMGFSVQLFETLAWAEELLPAAAGGRRVAPPSSLHRRRLRLLRGPRRGRPGERASGRRAGGRRPLRPVRAGVRDVRRGPRPGLLRRPGSLHRADRRGGAALRQRPRLRPRLLRRRPPVGRPDRGGAGAHRGIGRRRPPLGNPYWVAYALWIAGMAFSRTNARRALAAWEEGVAFVHEHRIHFFEGFLARDAARLNTSDGEPDVALGLFAEAIEAFHRAGNVPQLIITLASVPALFERLDRLEPAACSSARCRGSPRASTTSPNWPSSGTGSPPARRDQSG